MSRLTIPRFLIEATTSPAQHDAPAWESVVMGTERTASFPLVVFREAGTISQDPSEWHEAFAREMESVFAPKSVVSSGVASPGANLADTLLIRFSAPPAISPQYGPLSGEKHEQPGESATTPERAKESVLLYFDDLQEHSELREAGVAERFLRLPLFSEPGLHAIGTQLRKLEIHGETDEESGDILRPARHCLERAFELLIRARSQRRRAVPRANATAGHDGGVRLAWLRRDKTILLVVTLDLDLSYIYEGHGPKYVRRTATGHNLAMALESLD